MNIIVVEDEPRIREGIVGIIANHTAHRVIAVEDRAETGLEKIVQESPDLVITDIKMGDMDGLTMLEKARQAGVGSDFIILTGYSSFDYARQAIRLNVAEYLLKPVMAEELLGSLDRIEAARKGRELEEVPLSRLFEWQLTNAASPEHLEELLRTRHEVNVDAEHMLVVFELKSVDRESFGWTVHQIKGNAEMLCLENAVVIELFSQRRVVLLLMQTGRNQLLEQNLEQYILSPLFQEVRCVCSARRFEGLAGLKQEFESCCALRSYALLMEEGQMITEQRRSRLENLTLAYPDELEQRLKNAIYHQDGQEIEALCGEFEAEAFSGKYTPQSMVEVLTRFLCTICVTAEEKEPDLKGSFCYSDLLAEIGSITSHGELVTYFRGIVAQICREGRKDDGCEVNNLIVSRVVAYIQKNYMNEIALSTLAESMALTPEYVSALFRKEMGINFSSFLKNFRISHAKRMLEVESIKIQDIAAQVGFNDPKYFNRVFKEACGLSPSDYRGYQRR